MRRRLLTTLIAAGLAAVPVQAAPGDAPAAGVALTNPAWTRDAVIYQINTRQFTPEGTRAAAQQHLERLAAMGVDIIWLMPIHPIGLEGRKGSLGSPYAVRDYLAVNPELGTEADLA
ncbi:MAG: alpha-amylase family glycosyl hydrolase, partial [Erythrobacter cryptus]